VSASVKNYLARAETGQTSRNDEYELPGRDGKHSVLQLGSVESNASLFSFFISPEFYLPFECSHTYFLPLSCFLNHSLFRSRKMSLPLSFYYCLLSVVRLFLQPISEVPFVAQVDFLLRSFIPKKAGLSRLDRRLFLLKLESPTKI